MPPLALIRDRLLIILSIIALLYLGRGVLVPLAYGLLTAMIMYPWVARLERRGVARPIAITAGILVLVTLFSSIVGLLLWEFSAFLKELPRLSEDAHAVSEVLREWAGSALGLSPAEQNDWSSELMRGLPGSLGSLFMRSADTLFDLLFNIIIVPVFATLVLYTRRQLFDAVMALAGPDMKARVPSILHRSIHRFSAFISGMVKVYLIVGILNSIGLMLLGVPNAILFGMLTALMTIIPYIGIIISSLLPITMGYVTTGNVWVPIGVVLVFAVVQYLEANILFPRIVGGELGLNTLGSILIVLAGALLWGVSGMVLLLPYVSILLLLCEEIPEWNGIRLFLGRTAIDPRKKSP